MTENLRGIATASATAKGIRARILDETGLTASAGISYCKFIAKLASDFRKPNGQYVVPPDMGPAFVEALPVTKFYGVGPVTAAKMHGLGIQTGADLRDPLAGIPPAPLRQVGALVLRDRPRPRRAAGSPRS